MRELLLRFKAHLNTFWRRFRNWALGLGLIAGTATDFIRLFLDDPLVPDEWRPIIRVFYSICLFAALQAQFTVKDYWTLKHRKHNIPVIKEGEDYEQ